MPRSPTSRSATTCSCTTTPTSARSSRPDAILALDGLIDDAFIADQAANSVGPSHASYEWEGHLWALAIDAAGHVSAYRPDLLERLGVGVPETWDDIWELDRVARPQGMHVSLPMKAVDTLATWLTLAANAGVEPYADEERILPRDVGLEHLETLHRLAEMSHPDAFAWNPILLLERMATADDVVACPILFGYSNYSRPGFRDSLVQFRPVPSAGLGPRGGVIGGAGLGISAHTQQREAAIEYATYVGLSRDPAHALRRVGRPARPPLGVARPGRERAVHGLLPRHAPRSRRRLPAAALRRRADRPERGRRHHLGAPADRWRPERPARPPRRPLPAITQWRPRLSLAVRGPWVALELRSSELAVAVLPENGCDIVEVIDRSTGVDVMVRTPWGYRTSPGHGPDVARALSRAVLGRLAGAAAERRRRDGAARRRVGVPWRGGHHRVAGRRARRCRRAPVGIADDRSARDRARDPACAAGRSRSSSASATPATSRST